MLASSWILMDGLLKLGNRDADLAYLFSHELGTWAKVVTSIGYFIIFYGILVAYLAGAASSLTALSGKPEYKEWYLVAFFAFATGLTLFGPELVRKWNVLFMVCMGTAFVLLCWQACNNFEVARLDHMDWPFLPSAMPIICTAFCFHPLLPTAARSLNFNRKLILKALLLGTLFPLIVNAIWSYVIIGALPLAGGADGSILSAFHSGQPATIPLAAVLHSKEVEVVGAVFAVLAITTSYLAVGISLMSFFKDLASARFPGWSRTHGAIATFLPPLIVTLIYPDIFLVALNMVGGVGICLVFGLLPTFILLKESGNGFSLKKIGGIIMLLVFLGVMTLEVLQELGLLEIHPDVEYWMM